MAQDYPVSDGASLGFEAGSPDFKSCVPSSNSHSFDFLLFSVFAVCALDKA